MKLQTVLILVKPKPKTSKDLKLRSQLSARIAANRCNTKAKVEIFKKDKRVKTLRSPKFQFPRNSICYQEEPFQELSKVKNLQAFLVNQQAIENEIQPEMRFEMKTALINRWLPPFLQVKCEIEK